MDDNEKYLLDKIEALQARIDELERRSGLMSRHLVYRILVVSAYTVVGWVVAGFLYGVFSVLIFGR